MSPLLSLSSTKENASVNEIEELHAVQRQQEHIILSIKDTLNDLLSSVKSLTSKIGLLKVLSQAKSK
ncbi:24524_t:CDS:2, partial [Racocetra persica]